MQRFAANNLPPGSLLRGVIFQEKKEKFITQYHTIMKARGFWKRFMEAAGGADSYETFPLLTPRKRLHYFIKKI